MQITSDRIDLLEKYKHLIMTIERNIPETTLDVYPSYNDAVAGGSRFSKSKIRAGVTCPVFITGPASSKVCTN